MKRKLTTIFYADGAGFSAQMEADEAGTLTRLKRAREIMGEVFAARDGRQVNTWGDAVIAEFASVVEAVRAAVDIQDTLRTESLGQPRARRMDFRIGINLGDVMIEGHDIYGDGVNVAERLQSLAEPGGIVVSETVQSLVHKQLALQFDAIGASQLKHLEEPVPAYRILNPARNAPPEAELLSEEAGKAADNQAEAVGFARLGSQLDGYRHWVMQQPRGVQRSVAMILVLFSINVLFTGIAAPWFVFPSIPFAFHIWRHIRAQGPGGT